MTAMETSVGAVTVRAAEPETVPKLAVTVAVPAATAVASPVVAAMVATGGALELHVTVMAFFEPSVYTPIAVNCCVIPATMLAVAGVTLIDASVAAVTVKVAAPEMLPEVAVMLVEPTASAVATPLGPIVATDCALELHVTATARLEPSL